MILIVQKTVKEHTNAVCLNLYCIFLTWGPFLLKSGPLCITISFLFVILSLVAGITWWELKTRGWGAGFLYQFDWFKEKKSWFIRIMIYAQGGWGSLSLCDPSLIGIRGILFCVSFYCAHMLCCLPPPPTPSYFPFFMFLTYSTSPCCVFLNQWTSHSEALWGFFCSPWLSRLSVFFVWVSEWVLLEWVWVEILGCFCLLIFNVKKYVCTEILRSQWLLMFYFCLFSLFFSLLIECDCWHAPKKNVLNYGASFKQLINCIFVLGCNEFDLVIEY